MGLDNVPFVVLKICFAKLDKRSAGKIEINGLQGINTDTKEDG